VDIARTLDDQDIQRMVTDLPRDSPAFAAFWNSNAGLGLGGGARRFSHPIHGAARCDQMTLVPSAFPNHKIVILLPAT
jgi:hypothetical protein